MTRYLITTWLHVLTLWPNELSPSSAHWGECLQCVCLPICLGRPCFSVPVSVFYMPVCLFVYIYIFFCQCHHMSLMDFAVSPTSCCRSVTDFWVWDAHEAQFRCPDEVDGDTWKRSTRRGLKPKLTYTNCPDRGHHKNLPLQWKIPIVELEIEPGT
jgi:hypothetical protein